MTLFDGSKVISVNPVAQKHLLSVAVNGLRKEDSDSAKTPNTPGTPASPTPKSP